MDEHPNRCPYCDTSGVHPGIATLDLGRNGVEIKIRGIPATVCDHCDGFMMNGPLAEEIWDATERIISAIERHNAVPAAT